MFTKNIFKLLFFSALILGLAIPPAHAQVVSSGMTGTVALPDGTPVSGARVTAVHTPTNTTFTATTSANGRFSFRGMPVGGPYRVSAAVSNYEIEPLTDVETSLGEEVDVLLVAKEEVIKLEKLVATASRSDLDANATGASSVLTSRRIEAQPTASRAFADLIKTNPFVTVRGFPQVQALGMNNRYNTITLDGAKINDSFGLSSSGLFSLNNPFSLDAIEQFSISLTPYDVRASGFAGAAINAVSKSGTNEFHGTVYDVFTDSNWQGKDLSGTNIGKRSPLKDRVYGFTLGGPVIPDHLFFFTNFEKFIQDSAPSSAGFTPDSAFLSAVTARVAQLPSAPDAGTFGAASTTREFDTKRLAKLDWNITQDHRLSVRYSDTIGARPNFGSFNSGSFSQPVNNAAIPNSGFTNGTTSFTSNFYTLDVKEHVWATQLFSNWSSDLKTQFAYSNTKQDSVRDTPVIFPEIRILNVPGTSSTGKPISTLDAFRFGTETSSMGNALHIKTQTYSGSADYSWKTLTFTAGADYEASDYFNLFRQGSFGIFSYNNLADFQADKPTGFERAVVQQGVPVADISKFEDTGVFGQIKWEPIPRFSATLGFRVDYLNSPIAPPENTVFKSKFGVTNAGTIDGTNVPAPRFGFNYALDSKRNTQIRGGLGVFLGRNPWVWISNSYGNFGTSRFTVLQPSATSPTLTQYLNGSYTNADSAYKFDASNPVGTTSLSPSASTDQVINLIKPGLKLPTIERGNLAVDHKLPFMDATISVEYIYTEQLSALFTDNMNLKQVSLPAADGRMRFVGSSSGANSLVGGFGNVIRTRNVHAGKSHYGSITLDRPFKNGWAYTVSYTRGHATEAQTLNSSTANSQWQFNSVFNQNQVEVARSDYEVKDRLQVSLSREFRIKQDYVTTVSLYYEGRSGQPYSFVYTNDLNTDGFFGNDLIAVPTGLSDSRFDFSGLTTQAQKDAYIAFFKDNGLSKFAGSYAPRNAILGPWQNRLDLRFVQELPIVSLPLVHKVKIEVFADFINFGSWLSRSLFNYVDEINTGTTFGGLTRSLGSASYTATGLIKPTASFDADNNLTFASSSQILPNNGDARWRVLAGVKLRF